MASILALRRSGGPRRLALCACPHHAKPGESRRTALEDFNALADISDCIGMTQRAIRAATAWNPALSACFTIVDSPPSSPPPPLPQAPAKKGRRGGKWERL
ncbi:MAG: hypothetical protein AABZ64_07350 [Nitrospinota bacterium]